ncbi:MAG TPA: nuclear transport factor 2 family protein [Terriglobales bacterium]|nr:nuclear transport factor 2 family protein [Terriglobales bacterium]
MVKLCRMRVTATAAFVFAASAANVLAGDANAAKAVEKAAPAGPTQVALLSLETSAYEAWKSKDAKFWEVFLSDKFVGWGSLGRLDKASATKEYTGADCEIESYAISGVQVTPLGEDAALITHKVTVNGTCGGQKNPPGSWAATVYVRDGNQWKAGFHAQAAIIDPAAPPVKPVGTKASSEQKQPKLADRDALSDTLLPLEKAIWEAWKDHDAKRLDGLTSTNMQFINIFGIHLTTKAEALKNWSGEGCDVKTVALTDAAATMISPTVGILTFHASADGACFGQKVGPVWGSSIYVKDGDTWKWNFGINLPARLEGD